MPLDERPQALMPGLISSRTRTAYPSCSSWHMLLGTTSTTGTPGVFATPQDLGDGLRDLYNMLKDVEAMESDLLGDAASN